MPRRFVTFFAAAAVTAGISAAPATAAPASPGSGCPGGFNLVDIGEVLEIADPGFVDAIRAEDRNNDDQLCLRLLPEKIPLFEPTFLFYDNRVPTP